jgi:hypothetical protein
LLQGNRPAGRVLKLPSAFRAHRHPAWFFIIRVTFPQRRCNAPTSDRAPIQAIYELKGDELHITFPPTVNQEGQEQTTVVILKKLSGEKEMLGQ